MDKWELAALVVKTREGTWKRGLFLKTKDQVVAVIRHQELRKWLRFWHGVLETEVDLDEIVMPELGQNNGNVEESGNDDGNEDIDKVHSDEEELDNVFYDIEEQ